MNILVFDIGNTQIKMGYYEGDVLAKSWRMTTGSSRTTDEYGINMRQLLNLENIAIDKIDAVAISSVVPNLMHSFTGAVKRYLGKEPLVIGPGVKTGVNVRTPNPNEVGADLITDVAAATEYYGYPCIIVDFGTATKYEVVNEKGEFIAAVFSPGIGISAEALAEKAAQLPHFEIRKPKTILTNTTIECMQAGIVYGYIGQVQYIVSEIKREMNLPDMKVIATGGFGRILAENVNCFDHYDPTLTLKGVKLIAERYYSKKKRNAKA